MFKIVLAALLITLASSPLTIASPAAKGGGENKTSHAKKGKPGKKRLSRQEAHRLQKKAETEGKSHENEARRREYQLMLQSQRLGIEQKQVTPSPSPAPTH